MSYLGKTFKIRDFLLPVRTLAFIYRITNRESGRFYIGKTIDLATRIRSHSKSYLTDARLLGNPSCWKIEVIEEVKIPKNASAFQVRVAGLTEEGIHIQEHYEKYGIKLINRTGVY